MRGERRGDDNDDDDDYDDCEREREEYPLRERGREAIDNCTPPVYTHTHTHTVLAPPLRFDPTAATARHTQLDGCFTVAAAASLL